MGHKLEKKNINEWREISNVKSSVVQRDTGWHHVKSENLLNNKRQKKDPMWLEKYYVFIINDLLREEICYIFQNEVVLLLFAVFFCKVHYIIFHLLLVFYVFKGPNNNNKAGFEVIVCTCQCATFSCVCLFV